MIDTFICEYCHSAFQRPHRNDRVHRFCCRQCADKSKIKQKTIECIYCHKIFHCNNQRNKNYCSQRCFYEARKEKHRKRFICQYCGKEFFRVPHPSEKEKCTREFCSPICRNKARKFREIPRIDYGKNWSSQNRKARKRDNNTCQICGAKNNRALGYIIDVHHKIPHRLFDNYEEANKLENLICLCRQCHAKEDAKLRQQSRGKFTLSKGLISLS